MAATSSISAAGHSHVTSSLKRRSGWASSRRAIGSNVGGSPSPSELTKRTGDGVRPIASCSEVPACASARSSAADSNAQLRQRCIPSHGAGTGHWSISARWSQKDSSVHVPASSNTGPTTCSA